MKNTITKWKKKLDRKIEKKRHWLARVYRSIFFKSALYHASRLHFRRFLNMAHPDLYVDGNPNSVMDFDQVKWLDFRCPRCNSIFTVTIKKDDIPVESRCMSCLNHYIFPNPDEEVEEVRGTMENTV